MNAVFLFLSALVAALIALLKGLISPACARPVAKRLAVVAVLCAVSVLAAPVPAPSGGFAAVVAGLPSCAQPVMTSLLSRAADFDCGRRADGTLDLACVCQSRPFKTEAKRAVGDVCHDPADIGAARKWAIARCTAILLESSLARLPSAAPGAAYITSLASSAASMPPNEFDGAHKSSGGIGSTLAPQEAIFDIDDDEDWTAGAGIVRPLVTFVVVLAVSVAVMLV